MSIKTYSGAGGIEAGVSSTKLRSEQIKSEDGFTSLAVDLEALRGQVKDIIGSDDYKEEITGEYAKVQIVDLAAHIDASGASSLSVKQAANVVGAFSVNTDKFSVAAATGNTAVKGTLDVDGQATLASVNVEDLTSGRIVYAGASGELIDSAEMTFGAGGLTLAKDLSARSGSFSGDVTISGNLLVSGDTVTVNVGELTVEDKNILIANVATPSDATADGAGITIKGTTNKTILWVDASDSFVFSEPVVAPSGSFLNLASRLAKSDAQGKLVNAEITDFVQGTANQVVVGAVNGSGMSTLSLPQSIHTDADVEFDTLKLGDNVADAGKALKIGAAGEVIAAAWNEFVAIEANVGLELVQSGFKAEIGLAQDIRNTATIRFAKVELDGVDNYVDSNADGLVLHAGLAGDSIVFEYDAGKTIKLGTASLVGFTATDIMGALNELKSAATAASKKAVYTVAGSAVASGTDIKASLSTDFLAELTGQNSLVFVNGMLMQAGGTDYTLAGGALSFTFALQVGDVVVVQKA